MGSTGSVSSWEESLLVAAIQYPVPVVTGPADIKVNVEKICKAVANTKAGYPGLDLIVFPDTEHGIINCTGKFHCSKAG